MIIRVPILFDFLHLILSEPKLDFEHNPKMSTLTHDDDSKKFSEFDGVILNYSLRQTICKIFFNMRNEPKFFKVKKVNECIGLIVRFVISLN